MESSSCQQNQTSKKVIVGEERNTQTSRGSSRSAAVKRSVESAPLKRDLKDPLLPSPPPLTDGGFLLHGCSTSSFQTPLPKPNHVRISHSLHPPIKNVRLVEGCHPMLRGGGRPGRGRPRGVRCAQQGHGVVPCRSDARGTVSLPSADTDIRSKSARELRHRVDVFEEVMLEGSVNLLNLHFRPHSREVVHLPRLIMSSSLGFWVVGLMDLAARR